MYKKQYFSTAEYKKLLLFFKKLNYRFVFFSKKVKKEREIILRHDVDIDVSKAYEMANLEKQLNIKSTYFFLTTSKLYNCLDSSNRQMIRKIYKQGHQIGLHFDLSNHTNNSKKIISKKLKLEKSILEDCISSNIKLVSFHKPGINGMPDSLYYNKLLNIYNNKFIKEILYYSDSKGSWRFGIPTEDKNIYKHKKSLQLLIHPIWWISKKILNEKNNYKLLKNHLNNSIIEKLNYLKSYKKF